MKVATRKALKERGFDTIDEYLEDLADEHGVEFETARAVYGMLGESELFDGVVSAMEDAEAMGF